MSPSDPARLYILIQTIAAEQMESTAQLLKQHGLTSPQYNVLRILRGAGAPLKCTEIGKRMWTRDSDVTRLLDRLESRGLAARCRSTEDRRALEIGITEAGLSLLKKLDGPVKLLHQRQFAALAAQDRATLGGLLDKLSES